MSLTLLGGIWGLLFLVVVALAAIRKLMTKDEDDSIHLADSSVELVHKQQSLAGTLTQIDRWGKVLTVATVLYGIALVGRFVYMGWMGSMEIK